MRLLVTTHYWAPHRGGIESVAREQCQRLAARGHQVVVLTSRLNGDPPRQREGDVEIIRIPANVVLEQFGVPHPFFAPELLFRALREAGRCDVVLSHSHVFQPTVAGALAAAFYRRPQVILQHNTFVEYGGALEWLERAADVLLGGPVLRRAALVLAVSEETRKYVERISGRGATVLHNGVDTQTFRPLAEAEQQAVRARLKLPQDRKLVLTVRRLVEKNGLGTLIAALPQFSGHLVLAGGGPDRNRIEAHIKEMGLQTRVSVLGFVEDALLPSLYAACDLFVLPSKSGEGFPMVVTEALACGLPVVATRSGGHVDILDLSVGRIVPPSDPASLANAIEEYLRDPDLLSLARAAALKLSPSLDWEPNVTLLETHLKGCQ